MPFMPGAEPDGARPLRDRPAETRGAPTNAFCLDSFHTDFWMRKSFLSFHTTTWKTTTEPIFDHESFKQEMNNERKTDSKNEWNATFLDVFGAILAFKVSHPILIQCAVPVQAMMLEQKSTDAEEKSRRVGETWPSQKRFLLKVSLSARLQPFYCLSLTFEGKRLQQFPDSIFLHWMWINRFSWRRAETRASKAEARLKSSLQDRNKTAANKKKPKTDFQRNTLRYFVIFFWNLQSNCQLHEVPRSLLRIKGIKDRACELWWFDILSIPPSLNTLITWHDEPLKLRSPLCWSSAPKLWRHVATEAGKMTPKSEAAKRASAKGNCNETYW